MTHLVARAAIRLRHDLTVQAGETFSPAEHGLTASGVAELLALGAAEPVPEAVPEVVPEAVPEPVPEPKKRRA